MAAFALLGPGGIRPAGAATILADEAADICAAAENPCVVTDTVLVSDGAVLDFGVRALEIQPSGKLAFGSGSATLRCGDLVSSNADAASIQAQGPGAVSGADGGSITIEARGRCEGTTTPCLHDAECAGHSCIASTGMVRLLGATRVDGGEAGVLVLTAAGDIVVGAPIIASASDVDSDGGAVKLVSTTGLVRIDAPISAVSGKSGEGGEADVAAAVDVLLNADLDVSGGEFDGGSVFLEAGRDAIVGAGIHANATRLDGAGGTIDVSAARDLRIAGAALLEADGGRTSDFAADGGSQTYFAGRDLVLNPSVIVSAQGARPDGAGGIVELEAAGAVTLAATIRAGSLGLAGSGGTVSVEGCDVTLVTGGAMLNPGDEGDNTIAGHEGIVVQPGSEMRADTDSGENHIVFGDAAVAPIVQGTIEPAAVPTFDAALGPCGASTTTLPSTTLPPTTVPPTTVPPTTLGTTTSTHTTATSVTTTTGPPGCGDGVVDASEQCDGGSAQWRIGMPCRFDCTLISCGDPDDSGRVTARDAQFILRAAIGIDSCAGCICDVDSTNGPPRAGDALRVLRRAVGFELELLCPACS